MDCRMRLTLPRCSFCSFGGSMRVYAHEGSALLTTTSAGTHIMQTTEQIAANATSAVAVFPGYLGGAVGFRRELAGIVDEPADRGRRLVFRAFIARPH